MDEIIIVWIVPLLVIIIDFVLMMLIYHKNPPYVSKNDKNRYNDSISVFVYTIFRHGTSFYLEYIFIKRKNGKYRLRFSVFDFICVWLSMVAFVGLYVGLLIYNGHIITDYPDIGIPFFIALLITLVALYILINISRMVARIYFKKFIKGLK